MRRVFQVVLPVVVGLALFHLSACNSNDASGDYQGEMTVSDAASGETGGGNVEIVLAQESKGLSGSLTWKTRAGAVVLKITSGLVSGNDVTFTAQAQGSASVLTFKGQVAGDQLSGATELQANSIFGQKIIHGTLKAVRRKTAGVAPNSGDQAAGGGNVPAGGNATAGGLIGSRIYIKTDTPKSPVWDESCTNAGDVAIGGGASTAGNTFLRESRPATNLKAGSTGGPSNAWRVICSNGTGDTVCTQAYVICLKHGS